MTQIYSQELSRYQLDSLYTKFLQIRAPELLGQKYQPIPLSIEDRKCGFGIVNEVKSNFDNFTFEQRQILKQILYRPPDMQKSIISPSGFFRVHFDTTNSNGNGIPSYVSGWSIDQNVAEVAKALDSAYNFEVNFLGFPPPPPDGDAGGDYRYDIYIIYQNQQDYGYTEWENKVGPVNWTSFMVIDNNYYGFSSSGLDGMKVTVAHEFHHGIQFGNYAVFDANSPVRSADTFFYELTSTSMEEFVYDDVNDYYYYINHYTNNPARVFSSNNTDHGDGYDLAIWNIYLVKNYGYGIIKRQWELMPTQRAMIAIGNSLLERNSNFTHDYNRFGIWTFFTNTRSVQGKYFEEAKNYPLVKNLSDKIYPQETHIDVYAKATSNNFVKFGNTTNGDSLYVIITNGDISSVLIDPTQTFQSTYTLYSDPSTGERMLGDTYSATFQVPNSNWWSVSEILNGIVVREDSANIPLTESSGSFVFPNPFKYNGYLSISFQGKLGQEVDFNVYSSDMILVYSKSEQANSLLNNTIGVSWDGKDLVGDKLASGVYIYVIKRGDDILKGKVVIFNE